MSRSAAVTFKGTPMTLLGEELKVGDAAPSFTLHFFDGGLKTLSKEDVIGKPSLISVVPSLDTGVCQVQTKRFNEQLAALGDKVNSFTISCDLPFAQNRFCGAEDVAHMRVASDYQTGKFGVDWGVMMDELKLLARSVFVLDSSGKVVYAQIVPEVTSEPDYEPALDALKSAS